LFACFVCLILRITCFLVVALIFQDLIDYFSLLLYYFSDSDQFLYAASLLLSLLAFL